MLRKILLLGCLLVSLSGLYCLPDWAWGRSFGGSQVDSSYDLVADAHGNVYVTGTFRGSASFDGLNQTAVGNSDIFIAKYSSTGSLEWLSTAGGAGSATVGFAIALDSANNVLVCGYFTASINVSGYILNNPGANGSSDIFVCKYTSTGDRLWAKAAGGSAGEKALAIAVGSDDQPVISGYISSNTGFGTQTLIASTRDVFIAKMDEDGNWVSAKRFGGSGTEQCEDLKISSDGAVYLTGSFSGTSSWGSFSVSSAGSDDVFISKLDSSFNVIWLLRGGGSSSDIGRAISLHPDGSILVAGNHANGANFGGTTLSTPISGSGSFVARMNPDGLWGSVRSFGAGAFATNACNDIAISPEGRIWCVGQFQGTVSFGTQQLSSLNSQRDMYVLELGETGEILWCERSGGTSPDAGIAVACRGDRGIYVTGIANDYASYGSLNLSSGYYDVFLGYLQTAPTPMPMAPEGIIISRQGTGIELSWSPVTMGTLGEEIDISGYRVYCYHVFDRSDEALIAQTNETSFIDIRPIVRIRYYRISAIAAD